MNESIRGLPAQVSIWFRNRRQKERLAAFKPQFLGEFTADHEGRKHLRALVDEVTRSQP